MAGRLQTCTLLVLSLLKDQSDFEISASLVQYLSPCLNLAVTTSFNLYPYVDEWAMNFLICGLTGHLICMQVARVRMVYSIAAWRRCLCAPFLREYSLCTCKLQKTAWMNDCGTLLEFWKTFSEIEFPQSGGKATGSAWELYVFCLEFHERRVDINVIIIQ